MNVVRGVEEALLLGSPNRAVVRGMTGSGQVAASMRLLPPLCSYVAKGEGESSVAVAQFGVFKPGHGVEDELLSRNDSGKTDSPTGVDFSLRKPLSPGKFGPDGFTGIPMAGADVFALGRL